MANLLPKYLLSAGNRETAAILALWSVHAAASVAADGLGSTAYSLGATALSQLCYCVGTSLLFCQLGLLAWWASLAGPRRFWRVVLSLFMLGLLIVFASRGEIARIQRIYEFQGLESAGLEFSPYERWSEFDWVFFSFSDSFRLANTAPAVLVAFLFLSSVLPCRLVHQGRKRDGTDHDPPDQALSDWQFGVRDLLAATAAVAAVLGLVAWLQPYPTWIVDYVKSAGIYHPYLLPYSITIVLATWFIGYFLLGRTICRRNLIILALLAVAVGTLWVLLDILVVLAVLGVSNWRVISPMNVALMFGRTFVDCTILAVSFILLRIAGFRISRAPSRILRRWSTKE